MARRTSRVRALVISFPGLPGEATGVLDGVHQICEAAAVAAGFMLARSHPTGAVPSVRHPDVPAGTGPVPLIAVRGMAEHGIVFRDQDETWSSAYLQPLGDRALHPADTDPFTRAVLGRVLSAESAS
jgi:uncharacterized protein DUF6875